jgi:hypothetical protein
MGAGRLWETAWHRKELRDDICAVMEICGNYQLQRERHFTKTIHNGREYVTMARKYITEAVCEMEEM